MTTRGSTQHPKQLPSSEAGGPRTAHAGPGIVEQLRQAAVYVETAEDRERRARLREEAIRRSQRRRVERVPRQGSLRFASVLLVLVATAVIVAIAMFQTLYYVMG